MAMTAVPLERSVHARLLEEQPTGAAGAPIPIAQALDLIDSGQFVNVTIALGDEHGQNGWRDHMAIPRLLVEAAGTVGYRCAAEVLSLSITQTEATLYADALPAGTAPGQSASIDFTDVTGTYHLDGTVVAVRPGIRPSVALHLAAARVVQLRRFVRVPVLIAPDVLEVQHAPGAWHAIPSEIVDISLGGIGVLVAEPLPGGSRLRADFALPGRFGPLAVRGRVVAPPGPAEARSGVKPAQRLVYRRGVAFDPMASDDLRRLQRALYYRQVELRRLAEVSLPRRPNPAGIRRPPERRFRWRFWVR